MFYPEIITVQPLHNTAEHFFKKTVFAINHTRIKPMRNEFRTHPDILSHHHRPETIPLFLIYVFISFTRCQAAGRCVFLPLKSVN